MSKIKNKQLVTTTQLDRIFTEEDENVVDYIRDGAGGGDGKVKDVQVDDKSVLVNKVANIKLKPITERIEKIEDIIPTTAAEDNKLVDKKTLNDSITSQNASFRGTVQTKAELKVITGEKNDYAFLEIIDETTGLVNHYEKYKYVEEDQGETGNWAFEFTLNNSAFTQDQWDAITSGINSTLVAQIETNKTDIETNKTNIEANKIVIAQEKERAEVAEKKLEDSIKEAGKIDDVLVDGTSVVTNKAASIDLKTIKVSIATEKARAEGKEKELSESIAAEKTRAEKAEEDLKTTIDKEIENRTAKDTAQDTSILANQTAIQTNEANIKSNKEAIEAEVKRAEEKEKELQNNIDKKIDAVTVDGESVVEGTTATILSKVKDIKINDASIIDENKEAAIKYDNTTETGFFITDLSYEDKTFTLNRNNIYKDEDLDITLRAQQKSEGSNQNNGTLGIIGSVKVAQNDLEVSGALTDGTKAGFRGTIIYSPNCAHKLAIPTGYKENLYTYKNNTLLVTGDLYQTIKWADLVALRDAGKLVKGKTYRIIDYKCTTTQTNTKSVNALYDILVIADDEKTLNENARAIQHIWTEEEKSKIGSSWIYGDEVEYTNVEWIGNQYQNNDYLLDASHSLSSEAWKSFNGTELHYTRSGDYSDDDYLTFDSVIELDGSHYGRWKRIEKDEDGNYSETNDSGAVSYSILNVALKDNKLYKIVEQESYLDTLDNQHLASWEIKYCIDNDTTRFSWAQTKKDIVNRKVYTDDDLWFEYKGIYDIGDVSYYTWYSSQFEYEGSHYLGSKVELPKINSTLDVIDVDNMTLITESYSLIMHVDYSEVHLKDGTGVVYYMKDEYNNEAPYDFKNIQFKRNYVSTWDDSVDLTFNHEDYPTDHYLMSDLWILDAANFGVSEDYKYFYTFTGPNYTDASLNNENDFSLTSTEYFTRICHNNHIGVYKVAQELDDGNIHIISSLNDIVFKEITDDPEFATCKIHNNNIANGCRCMTFDEHVNNVSIDTLSYNIVICNSTNIFIHKNCNNIFIGQDCYNTDIDNNCSQITLDANSNNADIGYANNQIYLYQGCEYNNIGNENSNITFKEACIKNVIGNGNTQIDFGANCSLNTFGNFNNAITFSGNSSDPDKGNKYIIFGNNNNSCNFYNNCQYITLGNNNIVYLNQNCKYLTVEDNNNIQGKDNRGLYAYLSNSKIGNANTIALGGSSNNYWNIGNNNNIIESYSNVQGKDKTQKYINYTGPKYLTAVNNNNIYITGPNCEAITMGSWNYIWTMSNSQNITIGSRCYVSLSDYWKNIIINDNVNIGYNGQLLPVPETGVYCYVSNCIFDSNCSIYFEKDSSTGYSVTNWLNKYHVLTTADSIMPTKQLKIIIPKDEVVYNSPQEIRVGLTGTTEIINKEYEGTSD